MKLGYGYFETNENSEPEISLLALEAGEANDEEDFKSLLPGRSVEDHVLVPLELELIYLLHSRSLLAFYVTNTLIGQVMASLQNRFACLHAATASRDGRGLMLCGAARCGKTVLSLLLLQNGFALSSDDVTLVSRSSMKVVPFPRAINIREEYAELVGPILEGARRVRSFSVADQERLLVDTAQPAPNKVGVNFVCFPSYAEGRETELHQVSPAEGLVALMQNRFYPLGNELPDYEAVDFEMLSRLLVQVSCFRLVFSDPKEACQALLDLVSAQGLRV